MNKKTLVVVAVAMLAGYALSEYIAKVPFISKVKLPSAPKASA